MRSLLSAGVDTTTHALTSALHALATWPDQWAALRDDPTLARAADRFDITRHSAGHVGFGTGIHSSSGRAIARLEGEILLTAMTRHMHSLELAGPARRLVNNTLRGFTELPLQIQAA